LHLFTRSQMNGDKISNESSVFDKWIRNQGFGSKDLAFLRESKRVNTAQQTAVLLVIC
jgi:hypothetical protein